MLELLVPCADASTERPAMQLPRRNFIVICVECDEGILRGHHCNQQQHTYHLYIPPSPFCNYITASLQHEPLIR